MEKDKTFDSQEEEEEIINNRYVTVKSYAKKCGVSKHAIYLRIKSSEAGIIPKGDTSYLEQTLLEEAEGAFIDTEEFPPGKAKRGRKPLSKK